MSVGFIPASVSLCLELLRRMLSTAHIARVVDVPKFSLIAKSGEADPVGPGGPEILCSFWGLYS